jgi:hypothetical protein
VVTGRAGHAPRAASAPATFVCWCRRDDAVLLRRVREGRVPHQQHGSQRQGRLGAQWARAPQSRYG